ncbi:nuclear transport factor 2 family protein [Aeromicrobium wangtongii]|uniref:nuclear transport factor 2 family protein n=1 Tax=Aeromicrobium wangtongii TaxID=2969247 RepID=UPI002016BB19|nr:nuclear transport factor 2 family protein [Aeromicrobium wangtongii]MCL3816954.1 nuclear transport factor 2 family protein [Aeromicrobium wangtongii]
MTIGTDDTIAIQSLYAAYNHAVDVLGDAAGVAACFVENGVYDHGRLGRYEGRSAIEEFMQRPIDEQEGQFQHWNDNLLIEGTAPHATATAYVMTVDCRSEQPVLARASLYRDELVKTADGWRFVQRRVGYPATSR